MTAASHLTPDFAGRTDWTVDDLAGLPPDLNYELINGRLILPSPWKVMLDLPALSARHKAMREHADPADHE
jgi:hypothetical protein